MPQPNVHPQLGRPVPALLVWLWTVTALVFGLAFGYALIRAPIALRPDRALLLGAAAAFPLPIALLTLLIAPPHAQVRRMLGEPATSIARHAVSGATALLEASLPVPLGMLAALLVSPEGSDDLLRGGCVVGTAVAGGGLTAIGLLLASTRHIAGGVSAAWKGMTGGGAFGPAETAPLLYAPALGFVIGLIPAALMVAVWAARPALLSPVAAAAVFGFVALVAAGFVMEQFRRLLPVAHAAQLVVEEALATPFAPSEHLAEPPRWMAASGGDPGLHFVARAWVRRFPASLLALVGLVAVAAAVSHAPVPMAVAVLVGLAVGLYASARVLDLERHVPQVTATVSWLAPRASASPDAERRLSARLALPALALVIYPALHGSWLPTLVAGACGVAIGWLVLGVPALRRSVPWASGALLALALLAAAVGPTILGEAR